MNPLFLALLLLSVSPAKSHVDWMRPEFFQLSIGMPRMEAVGKLRASGHTPKSGRDVDEVIVDYSDSRALTLQFHDDRLQSIRFELFLFRTEIRKAFEEERAYLKATRGVPKGVQSKSVVIYEEKMPNVMVVVSDSPESEAGKKGLGFLAVRYFAP
jgi:hypothetical protein